MLQRVLEEVDARAGGRELEAERAVLALEPRGADRQLEPAVRRVVDGDRLRREQPERAVGEAGDEQAEAHARR